MKMKLRIDVSGIHRPKPVQVQIQSLFKDVEVEIEESPAEKVSANGLQTKIMEILTPLITTRAKGDVWNEKTHEVLIPNEKKIGLYHLKRLVSELENIQSEDENIASLIERVKQIKQKGGE